MLRSPDGDDGSKEDLLRQEWPQIIYVLIASRRTISSEEYTSRRPAIDGGEPTGATFESWMRSKQKPL